MITCLRIDYGKDEIFTYEVLSKNTIRELDFLFDGKDFKFQSNQNNPILTVFKNEWKSLKCDGFSSHEILKKSDKKIVNVQLYGKKFKKNEWFNSKNYKIEEN